MASKAIHREAGLTYEEVCSTDSPTRLDAWRKLSVINNQGKHLLEEYALKQKAFQSIVMAIASLEGQVNGINNTINYLRLQKENEFSTDRNLSEVTQRKISKLEQKRSEVTAERRGLKQQEGSCRMAMLKISQQIQYLQNSQQNLEAQVKGEEVACGWQGGCFRVSL